jgi:hypothetical protein
MKKPLRTERFLFIFEKRVIKYENTHHLVLTDTVRIVGNHQLSSENFNIAYFQSTKNKLIGFLFHPIVCEKY